MGKVYVIVAEDCIYIFLEQEVGLMVESENYKVEVENLPLFLFLCFSSLEMATSSLLVK